MPGELFRGGDAIGELLFPGHEKPEARGEKREKSSSNLVMANPIYSANYRTTGK
jgi:hypothetical protein